MKKGLNAKIIIIACAVIIIGTVAAILIINKLSDKEESESPTGEVQTTDLQHVEELSYEDAVIAYQEAIRLNPEDMTNYIKLVKLHLENGHEEEAVEVAYEGIGVGKKIKEETGEVLTGFPDLAQILADIFKDFNRMDDLKQLLDELDGILEDVIFAEEADIYFPNVTASLEAGTYEEAQTLSLESAGKAIYYTLDGSEPTKESEVYEEPISLDGGEYIVKAMAQGTAEQETFGDVLTAEYTIEVSVPELTKKEMARVKELYGIVSAMNLSSALNITIKDIDSKIYKKMKGYLYDGERIVAAKNVTGFGYCSTGSGSLCVFYGDVGDYVAEGNGIYYSQEGGNQVAVISSFANGVPDGTCEARFTSREGVTITGRMTGNISDGMYDGSITVEYSSLYTMQGNQVTDSLTLIYKNGKLSKENMRYDEQSKLWTIKGNSTGEDIVIGDSNDIGFDETYENTYEDTFQFSFK